jgi:ribosomal-protein-alanine N-acetyltransferase
MSGLVLLAIDADLIRAARPPGDLERHLGVPRGSPVEIARGAIEATAAMLVRAPRPAPWGGYLALEPDSGAVVGTCGFKDGPAPDGTVEIAYFTFPGFEARGYATEMARRLVAIARGAPKPPRVVAHTRPELGASARILEKLGLRCLGEVVDPEDGLVWRWELDGAPEGGEPEKGVDA